MQHSQKKASSKFIFFTIFIDMLGIGLMIPVFPDVIRRFSSDPKFVNEYFGYFISIYALMQFLASPVLGSLSDKFGRRPILLVSLLCAGLDYILMAFANTLPLLFIGRVISGLTGASQTVATSYMSDVSDDSNRSANFGMIGAAFGLGFILGPAIGGLLGHISPKAPFVAAAIMNLANFAFGFFVLPESLPVSKRRDITLSKLNPFKSVFKILTESKFMVLIWIHALIYLSGSVHPANWTLYTEFKFGWTSAQVGASLAFVGICVAFVQGYLTRKLIPRMGERNAVKFGLSMYLICLALYAFASQPWMMYAITSVFALSGLAGPSLQSLISKQVPMDFQGELQGSLTAITSLAAVISPILYSNLFNHYTTGAVYFPGAAYAMASLISGVALTLFVLNERKRT
ncbi:MAG: TCR/Tet family MFS transporter [Xanthomonadaceae bacterium]|nr:TCR/Tet family MFS transporter [Xanthomonadaceae bacterium]